MMNARRNCPYICVCVCVCCYSRLCCQAYRLIESLQSAAAKRDGSMRDTSTVSASKSMNGDTEPTAIEGEFTEGDTQTGFAGQLTIEDWSLLVKGARTVVLPPHAAVVSTGHRLARIYQVASGSCVFGTESAHRTFVFVVVVLALIDVLIYLQQP